jgi:hypothetical protein
MRGSPAEGREAGAGRRRGRHGRDVLMGTGGVVSQGGR